MIPKVSQVDKTLLESIQKRLMEESTYWGIQCLKNPLDFWIYQEIIYTVKPDFIIEIGNFKGGGILAYAHMLDLLGHGIVIGVDLDHSVLEEKVKEHKRVILYEGDAVNLYEDVSKIIDTKSKVIVIEDSSHEYQNTLDILRKFSSLVSKNSYFIVEDGICHHGLNVGPSPGPFEAVETFLRENSCFSKDLTKENFIITWNPNGYLKRTS